MAGMGALQGDQVMVISDNSKTHAHCIFTSSSHIPYGTTISQPGGTSTIMRRFKG